MLPWRGKISRGEAVVVGVDPGSVAVRVVIAAVDTDADDPEQSIRLIGIGESPSQGIRRGKVVDRARLGAAIRVAVAEAERAAGHRVLRAYFAVPLPCLRPVKRGASVVLDDATALNALNFRDTEAATIWADVAERAGLSLAAVIPSVLAASTAVALPEEHAGGVMLVECGAEHTSIAVFRHGAVQRLGALPVGGDHLTRDLAVVLGLDPAEAERLKCEIGHRRRVREDLTVPARGGDGTRRMVPVSLVVAVIAARMDQMLVHVQELSRPVLPAQGASAAVLCGGGAGLAGIGHAARASLAMPVRVAGAWGFSGPRVAQSPAYAAALGLVRWRAMVQSGGGTSVGRAAGGGNVSAILAESVSPPVRMGQTRLQAWLREFLP